MQRRRARLRVAASAIVPAVLPVAQAAAPADLVDALRDAAVPEAVDEADGAMARDAGCARSPSKV